MYQPSGCTVYSTDYIKKSRNSERGGDDRESIYLQLRDKGKDRKLNIGAALLVPVWCAVWCVGVSLCSPSLWFLLSTPKEYIVFIYIQCVLDFC